MFGVQEHYSLWMLNKALTDRLSFSDTGWNIEARCSNEGADAVVATKRGRRAIAFAGSNDNGDWLNHNQVDEAFRPTKGKPQLLLK